MKRNENEKLPEGVKQSKISEIKEENIDNETTFEGIMSRALTILSWIVIIVAYPFSMFFCCLTIKQYERVVLFRLGRSKPEGARGPGWIFYVPCIDTYTMVDIREVSHAIPRQEILTSDVVAVEMDALVFFRISDPVASVLNVDDASASTKKLAESTIRNILVEKTLDDLVTDRASISLQCQNIIDEQTKRWGVTVGRVELSIQLPTRSARTVATSAARKEIEKFVAAGREKWKLPAVRNVRRKRIYKVDNTEVETMERTARSGMGNLIEKNIKQEREVDALSDEEYQLINASIEETNGVNQRKESASRSTEEED
ncbi:hypothetical protein PMAYCL1PPCAC_14658 [Pristionchus mayeri]|uniref:Band 7 domain-containing protein n=1 Tax=Pristionchus mayeri TaxID=1317129 RepID=A0AAN5CAQ6_9BILA|nr:hypothetical protein PMAYCL1PPCAC_14658 [Pristionchus mayeri]